MVLPPFDPWFTDIEFGATSMLTNLANRAQPLIRYDLGDRIKLHSQRCECGSPLAGDRGTGPQRRPFAAARARQQSSPGLAAGIDHGARGRRGSVRFSARAASSLRRAAADTDEGRACRGFPESRTNGTGGVPGAARRARRADPLSLWPTEPARPWRQDSACRGSCSPGRAAPLKVIFRLGACARSTRLVSTRLD